MVPITHPLADKIIDGPGPTPVQLLNLAKALAAVAHAGQTRKGPAQEPYFRHVERVAGRVSSPRARTVAYLHDVIEDTRVGPYTLQVVGFPVDIVADILALSRREGETYADFIARTIETGSDDALKVKLADLEDNLSDPHTAGADLTSRYIPAAARILEELERRRSAAEQA